MNHELMCYLEELLAKAVEDAENDMTRAIEQDLSDDVAVRYFKQFSRATKMRFAFEAAQREEGQDE